MLRTIRLTLLVSLWSCQAQRCSKRFCTPSINVSAEQNVDSFESVCKTRSSSSSPQYTLEHQIALCQQLQLIIEEHTRSRSSRAKKKMEVEAWCLLEKTPVDLSGFSLRGQAEIFGAIVHFAGFWERGFEGPDESNIERYRASEITTKSLRKSETRLSASLADLPRRSPLDEVLE